MGIVRYAVKGIEEKIGKEIISINLKKIPNAVCDYFVICEGDSRPQVEAIARSVEEFVEKNTGERPWHREGFQNAEWVLMDYVTVVVHIFRSDVRYNYGLENMWADAIVKRIDSQPLSKIKRAPRKIKRVKIAACLR